MATQNAITRIKADRIRRARSSRKWSDSAIRPSGPTGLRGLPRRTSTTPTMDIGRAALAQVPSGGGVVPACRLAFGRLPCLKRVTLGGLLRLELALRLRLAELVIVFVQALGLGLEDAQGTAAAACKLRKLRRTEHQDDDGQDDEKLWWAERTDQRVEHERS